MKWDTGGFWVEEKNEHTYWLENVKRTSFVVCKLEVIAVKEQGKGKTGQHDSELGSAHGLRAECSQ